MGNDIKWNFAKFLERVCKGLGMQRAFRFSGRIHMHKQEIKARRGECKVL